MVVIGFFFGQWAWPHIRGFLTKEKGKEEFISKRLSIEIRRAKFHYFKYLGRAHHKWKDDKYPDETIEQFIDSLTYPAWIKDGSELPDKIRKNIGNPPDRNWEFFLAFYEDFEKVIKTGTEGKFLKECEYEKFHECRQDLTYFWDEVGGKIYKHSTLRYEDVKPGMKDDERILISMCYLSVALFKANERYSSGRVSLYRLVSQYYAEKN